LPWSMASPSATTPRRAPESLMIGAESPPAGCFHDGDGIGLRMLAGIARRTGLQPSDL